jgi:transposase
MALRKKKMDIVNPKLPKEKNPTGRAPKFSAEYYMMMARQVVDKGMSYRTAANVYKCSHGTVSHWVRLYKDGILPGRVKKEKRDAANSEAALLRIERHVKTLKTEIGELYLENLMLKKALEYSHQLKKQDLSVITSEHLDPLPEDAE